MKRKICQIYEINKDKIKVSLDKGGFNLKMKKRKLNFIFLYYYYKDLFTHKDINTYINGVVKICLNKFF